MAGRIDMRIAVIAGIFAILSFVIPRGHADFIALWLAGDAYAHGQFDLVYPQGSGLFTMGAPVAWFERAKELGHSGETYPFLYPPVWAVVMAWITKVVPLPVALLAADVANSLLLVGTLALAHRMASPAMTREHYVAGGLILYLVTNVGFVALYQGQAQILIAFLTVLALERAENGRPVAAGIALAFAAALKLYPALLAILWLAEGRRRAAGVFAVSGATLGLLSVVLAGWPLHASFLDGVSAISATAMVTPITFSIDSLVGQAFLPHAITFVPSSVTGGDGELGWLVLAKPGWLRLTFLGLELAATAAFAVFLRNAADPVRRSFLWAGALIAIGLFGPISWSYHYLAPLAFAPLLADGPGWKRWGMLLLVAAGLSAFLPGQGIPVLAFFSLNQVVGTATLVLLLIAFTFLGLRTPRARGR